MVSRTGKILLSVILAVALLGIFVAARNGLFSKSQSSIGLKLMADGFVSPVELVESPDGTGRLFVADQAGKIYVLKNKGEKEVFLDLKSKMVSLDQNYDERGLLGLAFHPKYKDNGRFFVYYSAPLRASASADWNHTSHISEFKVSSTDPNRADASSEKTVMQVDEPQFNHNGGQIAFGWDGFLYIPLGDGGATNDVGKGHSPGGNSQDTSTLLGKILRIDVDHGTPYGFPMDNPFV